MKRFVPAAVLATVVLLLGWSSSGADARPCDTHYTVPQFLHFARAVLPDASPRDALELRHIIHCQAYKPHRAQLKRWWRAYENPPGWVIPWYVVSCESGGRNLPPNSATASGYYQIIDSTWSAKGGQRYASEAWLASKRGQDIIARRIWNEDGPSQWDCA